MNTEFLRMRRFNRNARTVNIALPVFAIECEATPPIENELDAYEEAVLKFISIGLSTDGIAHTLNASKSLVEEILDSLENRKLVSKERGKAWALTELGQKRIDGIVEEVASQNAQYGFMFVNAIKKEVLPYFYQGDLNQIQQWIDRPYPSKLTISGDEGKTFGNLHVKKADLQKAYRNYLLCMKVAMQYKEGEQSREEAENLLEDVDSVDEIEGLESFDEIEDIPTPAINKNKHGDQPESNRFIRRLNCKPQQVYLTMRLIIDPTVPSGYQVESPFDLDGIDDRYFRQQIQWLASRGTTFIEKEPLNDFLTREIKKLCPQYAMNETDYNVFLLERLHLLKACRNKYPDVYDDMARIYSLMQRQNSLIEKENIVSDIARYIVEKLFNGFFRSRSRNELRSVAGQARQDITVYGYRTFIENILKKTTLDSAKVSWRQKYLSSTIDRLESTHGNSIVEKCINLVVLNYYSPTDETERFVCAPKAGSLYKLIEQLNEIRKKVSHDTKERFAEEDYNFYIAHVFELVNKLLEANQEV